VLEPAKPKPGCLKTKMIHAPQGIEKEVVKAEKRGILASRSWKKKCSEKVNEGRRQGRVLEHNM